MDAPPTCRVWINGVEAQVRETAVNHQRVWTSRPMLSTSPVVLFTAEGRVEIEVAFLGTEVESAVVAPAFAGRYAGCVGRRGALCAELPGKRRGGV